MSTAISTSVHESWPALHIELVAVDSLIPYIRNPRQHSPEQIAQLAASMREFGWVNPVLRDEDQTILAGHGRIMAARKLDWPMAPVMTARGWSEAKKRAYVIADNKLALNATWDIDLLSSEIDSLVAEDFDIDLLGFSEADLSRLEDDLTEGKFDQAQHGDQTDTNGAAPPAHRADPDQCALTIPMTVSQRETIFEAIQKMKRDEGLDQSSEALWTICRHYLEQQ